ncbi:MAG: hypothetical protein C7B47_17970 [Sulfobacillus thermosulfidooxidans]|uniref:Uncharacterized protein n=1 Tax=Sulfobacillus thermosulfidooxidans TaxID=28034 RepID=A0A2T2WE58_SULTH|nr:MAG: hypothetical protein C7B47_17970 [Sulfobacillus thermosulfidooxidans]
MQRTKWLVIGGIFVAMCGAIAYGIMREHGAPRVPHVISVPSHAVHRSLQALSIQSSQASAWATLQARHRVLMTTEWQTIVQQFPSLSQASLGQLTPEMMGMNRSVKGPLLETPEFHRTITTWQQDLKQIPRTVAPSGIPAAVWNDAWQQTVTDVNQAVGPDPLALDTQLAPHEGRAFQRLIAHRYALWHTWQAQKAWMTTVLVSVGPFRPPRHRVITWTVIRPPTQLSTQQLHVITLTRVPFIVTEYLTTTRHHTLAFAQSGFVILGLFDVHHVWHWALETLVLDPPTTVPSYPNVPAAS